MKRLLYYGSILLVGLIVGLGSAWWAVGHPLAFHENGPWIFHPLLGNVAAGPYLRAEVARIVPLPVNASEAVYFLAFTDDAGDELRCDRDYRLQGRGFPSRWWSITCYDENGYLIPSPSNRYSYNMANLAESPDGTFTVHLSRSKKPGNWLPTGEGKRFALLLRIYNPPSSIRDHLAAVELPRIVREAPAHE